MKHSINNKSIKQKTLLVIILGIILIGVGILSFNVIMYIKSNYEYRTAYKNKESQELALDINNTQTDISNEESELALSVSEDEDVKLLYPERPAIGDEIGELYIPKLEVTLPIYHGTNDDELEKGVGHYAGSVLPGEDDNSVLSGHRDTVFRELGKVGEGDMLIVTTSVGEFEYKVNKVRIVDKDDRTVIVPKPKATLTISTCYPFDFIGAAPERYILVAYLVSETLNN